MVAAFKGTWRLPVTGVAVTVVAALVLAGAYPALVEQFRVRPNQRSLESSYIQRNIDATPWPPTASKMSIIRPTTLLPRPYEGQFDTQSLTSQVRLLDHRSSRRPFSSSSSRASTTALTPE